MLLVLPVNNVRSKHVDELNDYGCPAKEKQLNETAELLSTS